MSSDATTPQVSTAQVRRVPKYPVFLVLGAVIGVFAALILTFAFNGSDERSPFTNVQYSPTQVFGFLLLWTIPIGIALGGLVALVLDRLARRHTREVRITHELVRVADEPEPSAQPQLQPQPAQSAESGELGDDRRDRGVEGRDVTA